MVKYDKYGVRQYNKPNKSHIRNEWIIDSWKYNGAYVQKNKKKDIPRKAKYRGYDNYE